MANSNQPYGETFSIPQSPSKPPWKIVLGVIIVGLILGGYLTASVVYAQSREIHIVNGTDTMYKIKVNQNYLIVQPMSHLVTKVPEGEVSIERTGNDCSIDTLKIQIQTPLLTRLFEKNTFIINPDCAAILMWEREGYGENPKYKAVADAYDYKYHTGEILYHFENVDSLFVNSPAQIYVYEESSVLTRDRLSIVKYDSAEEAIALIESEFSTEVADTYLDNYLLTDPDSYEHLIILRGKIPNQQFLDYVKPLIEKRPVLLNCHRVYIEAMRNKDIEIDLVPQYRELLAESPDDPNRIYLLGKATSDYKESLALYRKAAEDPEAPEVVHHSLFLYYISTAQFNKALNEIGILRISARNDLHYLMHSIDTLVALKRETEALKIIRTCAYKEPANGYIVLRQLTIEYLVNGIENTSSIVDKCRREIFAEYQDSDYADYWKTLFSAHMQYISGDGELSAQSLSKEDNPYPNFIRDITLGRFENMDTILNELGEDVDYYLTAALAALEKGDRTLAKPWLRKAAELLEAYKGKTSRRIAGWLRSPYESTKQIDYDLICNYSTHASTKRLILAVMALLDPNNETQYFTLARKLNFDRQFPYLLIKQVVGE